MSKRSPRKGLPVHVSIIEGYMKGLPLREEDRVVVFDILPNRLVPSPNCQALLLLIGIRTPWFQVRLHFSLFNFGWRPL